MEYVMISKIFLHDGTAFTWIFGHFIFILNYRYAGYAIRYTIFFHSTNKVEDNTCTICISTSGADLDGYALQGIMEGFCFFYFNCFN